MIRSPDEYRPTRWSSIDTGRRVLLGRRGRGPARDPALRRLRHAASSTRADVRKLRLVGVGHRRRQSGVAGSSRGCTRSTRTDPTTPPRIVILVQLEEGTRSGLEPGRPAARRSLRRPPGDGRDSATTAARGRRSSGWRTHDRHHRRRHRRDRVLEGVGTQRDAARGRGVPRRDPRRRPHAGRHRRHGHLHRRRQRRAGADAQPRAPAGDLVVAHAGRRHGRVRAVQHAVAAVASGLAERGARVPRVQRAVRATATGNRTRRRRARRRSTGTATSASTRRRRCTRSGSAVTCTRSAPPTRTSVGTRSSRAGRGDQPQGVVLRAPDHARRPPGIALDRRAGAAAATTAARRATAGSRWS